MYYYTCSTQETFMYVLKCVTVVERENLIRYLIFKNVIAVITILLILAIYSKLSKEDIQRIFSISGINIIIIRLLRICKRTKALAVKLYGFIQIC